MSRESALEFLKLTNEDPTLLEKAKKCMEGDKISYEALSKLAKENKLECSAKELEEAMNSFSNLTSGELDENDLESVSGGGLFSGLARVAQWFQDTKNKIFGNKPKKI